MDRIKNEPDVPIGAGAAYCARQPLGLRIWQALGFRHTFNEDNFEWRNMDPPQDGFCVSAFHTETHIILDWKDRLRALVTGHIGVDVYSKTDKPVIRAQSRSEIAVLPPIRKSSIRQDP